MTQINVDGFDKDRFDEFKDSDQTQKEAFSEVMDIVQAFEGDVVDHEQLAEELSHTLIPMVEVSSFRGSKEAVQEHGGSE